jgi:hypothetical protein
VLNYLRELIAAEISATTRYYDCLIQWKQLPDDPGIIFDQIVCPGKKKIGKRESFPDLTSEHDRRTAVLLHGVFNHHYDIQKLLRELKSRLSRTSRLVVVAYNPYLKGLYRLANKLGLRKGEQPFTFITHTELTNICLLSGYDVPRIRPVAFFTFRLFGICSIIKPRFPWHTGLRWLGLAAVIFLRPIIRESKRPGISIIIPARNEKGNIENALKRLRHFKDTEVEIIFVEGNSSDGTWEEIQRVQSMYADEFKIAAFKQRTKGKNDAVRVGFENARHEVLAILDADLTMPPELLGRFYDAYCDGLADFINGTRLVYPMEGEAMRFLNTLGNIFFAKALSSVLDTRLGDSLCGTKLLARHDYERIVRWRKDFGDFDPFGDFELLFPAALLAFGIVDVPIRYLARTYGAPNIRRFQDGLLLLRMCWIGLYRIKMGQLP